MDNEDFNLMSNKELVEKYNICNEHFIEKQNLLKETYEEMIKISEQANIIKNIITKRGGEI